MNGTINFNELPNKYQDHVDCRLDANMQREMYSASGLEWSEDITSDIAIACNLGETLRKHGFKPEEWDPDYIEFCITA